MRSICLKYHPALRLCAGVALAFLSPVTTARLFIKDKYLELRFGDVVQAQRMIGYAELFIDETSSLTLHTVHVGGSFISSLM